MEKLACQFNFAHTIGRTGSFESVFKDGREGVTASASSTVGRQATLIYCVLDRLTLLARPSDSRMQMKYHPKSTCHQCQPRRAEPTEEW